MTDESQNINENKRKERGESLFTSIRGHIYANNFSNALNLTNEVIELLDERNPKYASAYYYLGEIYDAMGEISTASENFLKAEDLLKKVINSSNNENCRSHLHLGLLYRRNNKHDKAIEHLTIAANLRPDEEDKVIPSQGLPSLGRIYYHIGSVYLIKSINESGINENLHKALEIFSEAIKFHNQYMLSGAEHDKIYKEIEADATYYNRGRVYQRLERYEDALDDYNSVTPDCGGDYDGIPPESNFLLWAANECNKRSIVENERLLKLDKILLPLYNEVRDIIKRSIEKAQEAKSFSHYTSLYTLRLLTGIDDMGRYENADPIFFQRRPFHTYDATHMNDPNEGKVLVNKLNKDSDISEFFKFKNSMGDNAIACIGSFVMSDESRDRTNDLTLWRFYGKHDNIEASGCSLVYSGNSFSYKQESIPTSIAFKYPSESEHINYHRNPEDCPPIYAVEYIDDDSVPEKLVIILKTIKEEIKNWKNKDVSLENFVKDAVYRLIDEIRFLYKSSHYRDEGEARVIMKTLPSQTRVDRQQGNIVPRYFRESGKDFLPEKIIFGPNAPVGWGDFLQQHFNRGAERNNMEISIKIEKSELEFNSK